MPDLDNPNIYASLDPSGLGARLAELPQQCSEAWGQVKAAEIPGLAQAKDHVVICGMGGSAIAGDLAADLAGFQRTLPVTVVRDTQLPFKTDSGTLVIACSYSGETQETLALFQAALDAGSPVVAVTSGGTLANLAAKNHAPVLNVATQGEPRNALGYNLFLLLGLLQRLNLVGTRESEVQQAIEATARQISDLEAIRPAKDNQAKQIALELYGRLPLIYGGGIFDGVARRWKTQFNENAKSWAFFESIPELLHNTVEAFPGWPDSGLPITALVLQPVSKSAEPSSQYGVLAELLRRHAIPHQVLQGSGDDPLAQLLSMLILGDYVSYYLSMLNEVDPSLTPSLREGKRLLSGL